ncbi:MAG TPA: BatA and WFA domain-containing protein [Pirellulales bacterium]|nr:BatA and WFA domain-containing protein [Pirellulales bacterium]
MSFAFYYPLIWLGAAAVAAPIWLHLRRRIDSNVVRFSALQFLDDQPAVRRRSLSPRDLPLLLLRIAGLLLLVAAFAWPYRPDVETEVLIEESRVTILDNTLSHQAEGKFEEARALLLEELKGAGRTAQIAVVELTALPRVVVGFGDRPEEAADKVRALRPSHQRGSYLAAFRTADGLLDQSLGRKKRIILLGDSQTNQWNEGLHIPPFLERIELTLPTVTAPGAANFAVHEPSVRRVFLGEQAIVEASVRLFHLGTTTSPTVTLSANGNEIVRREVDLTGQPEVMTLSAQWEADPNQWLRGEVRVDGKPDTLEGDNRAFFSLPPVREIKVDLLARSPFLQTALSPEIARGRWKARVLSLEDLKTVENLKTVPPDDEADVLCIESQLLETAPARDRVLHCLNQGKGVVLWVNRITTVAKGFLRELGIDAQEEVTPAAGASGFRYIFSEHPVFHPFRSADSGDLMEIRVHKYRRLKVPEAVPLVFSEAGDALLFEQPKSKGKLLIAAFGMNRDDTNWPIHPTFIPFLDRWLHAARTEIVMPTAYQPGEVCVWNVPPDVAASEIVLRDAEREVLRAPLEEGRARFTVPDAPGLYALHYGESTEIGRFLEVNPAPDESWLTYTAPETTAETWCRPAANDPAASSAETVKMDLAPSEILRQKLWWWLLLAGLAALLTETGWLALRKDPA